MKKIINNKYFIDFTLVFVTLMLIEILFRIISGYTLFDLSLIRIIFGINIISFIVAYITSYCNNLISRIIEFIVILVADIYAVAQLGFYNLIGVYISFQEASQASAVREYVIDFLKSFKIVYYIPLIVLVIYLVIVILLRKKLKAIPKVTIKFNNIISVVLILVASLIYYVTLTWNVFDSKYQTISNKDLFLTVSNTTNSVTKFGTTMFGILDLRQKLFPVTVKESYAQALDYSSNNNYEDILRGITSSEWQAIMSSNPTDKYQALNEYFSRAYKSSTNEYTGLFAGKNVIFILLESVNDVILKYPEYYPNFNKLVNEGWYFENNYSPRNSCATLNNEYSGMTSLYSISNICTGEKYINNSDFQSVFNLFNKAGYVTFSAHNYTEAYYPRNKLHTNLGSGKYYGVEKLGIPYSNAYKNWSNDDEFLEKVLEIIDSLEVDDNQNFMTWLTTVSTHTPYSSSIQGDMYYSMTDGTGLPSTIRRYMSKLKILDNGLGILLAGLEARGILDDTVLVLYGDHYPYALATNELNQVLDYDTAVDMNAEKVPLVIYNSTLTNGEVLSQYTTYINILPTIGNLFNLDYDAALMMGRDLFDENYESLVVFADGSWKNENAYYNAGRNKVIYYTDLYTESDIERITADVASKLKVSASVIKTNYFKYLEEALIMVRENPLEETSFCPINYNDENN